MMVEEAIGNLQSNEVVMPDLERKRWRDGILHSAVRGEELVCQHSPHLRQKHF